MRRKPRGSKTRQHESGQQQNSKRGQWLAAHVDRNPAR
jgi:hypothetical protein